jgi:hypothetical protein
MKHKAKTADAKYTVSKGMQQWFVGLTVLSVLVQTSFMVYWMVKQVIQYDGNLNGYFSPLYYSVGLPVLLFTIAYLINPHKLRPKTRIFESMLCMTMGFLAFGILNQTLGVAIAPHITSDSDRFWSFLIFDLLNSGLVIVAYSTLLFRLRPKTAKA